MGSLAKILLWLGIGVALHGCGGSSQGPAIEQDTVSPKYLATVQTNNHEVVVQQLYLAFFGRPADPAGLRYFSDVFATLRAPTDLSGIVAAYYSDPALRDTINSLADSAEAKALYGDDATYLITAVYRQSFNRDAEAAGLEYWSGAIARSGVNRAVAVLAIVTGARNEDLDTFQRKAQAARMFTVAADTTAGRALYDGLGSNALVRDVLANVRGTSSVPEIEARIAGAMAALANRRAYVIKDGYAEVPAGERIILLLAAPDQLSAHRDRLDRLATVLAADMNSHSSPYGPVWKVFVRQAESSAPAVRDQLRDSSGAILVGAVPVPTRIDAGDGSVTPFLDPYRLPSCARYRFTSGAFVDTPAAGSDHIWLTSEDPNCRNGAVVSILRATGAERQQTEIASKLDQMIAYHRDRQAQDATWTRSYQRTNALWLSPKFGSVPDNAGYWHDIPLYTPEQLGYRTAGTGSERLAAFLACLGSRGEMCSFNGHGSGGLIVAEGPDPVSDFHSSDAVYFRAQELRNTPVQAKFVNLDSCSTHNFLLPDSFASTLLMSGQSLLTLGSTMIEMQSSEAEREEVAANYQSLSYGATFAEAYIGKIDNTPLNFQGDPFISLRPRPSGPQPKLVVDGKHYNAHPAIVDMPFGDSANGNAVFKTLHISNAGTADLRLRFTISSQNVTATGKVNSPNGNAWSGQGFSLVSPSVWNESGGGNTGNIIFVVKPGGALDVRMSLAPITEGNTGKRVTGIYSGTHEFYSNDPDAPRVILEMKGSAR